MEKENIQFKKQGIPINIDSFCMQEGRTYRGLHSHPAVEIIMVKNGKLNCYVNGELIEVLKNQTILINSNIGHRLVSDNADITYIQIDISYFKDSSFNGKLSAIYEFVLLSRSKSYMLFSNNKGIDDILLKILKHYHSDKEWSRWYLTAYIYELIAFMHSNSFIAPISGDLNIEKIIPIVYFLNENFKLPLNLDDISLATGYNKYTVCHLFKNITEKTIFDYINFLRIRYAIEELKQKRKSILEIAIESGFSSSSYFNRVFKNEIGCAPSEYRKYIANNVL